MGILNVTPNSFYDGGKFDTEEAAVRRALQMIKEGANIIDVGGESTGPGAEIVSEEEEMRRVIPVIEKCVNTKMRKYENDDPIDSHFRISIDTYKAAVARAALDAGASIVNDVTAGRADPAMFALIAERECDYVIMRSKDDSPQTSIRNERYDDVIATIHAFFAERIAAAEAAGILRKHIILDPGLGHFVSSDPKYSWEILEHLERLKEFGCRILVSPSRKSFTAAFPTQQPSERLEGTLKATRLAIAHGADIIRTHDVRKTCDVLGFRR